MVTSLCRCLKDFGYLCQLHPPGLPKLHNSGGDRDTGILGTSWEWLDLWIPMTRMCATWGHANFLMLLRTLWKMDSDARMKMGFGWCNRINQVHCDSVIIDDAHQDWDSSYVFYEISSWWYHWWWVMGCGRVCVCVCVSFSKASAKKLSTCHLLRSIPCWGFMSSKRAEVYPHFCSIREIGPICPE